MNIHTLHDRLSRSRPPQLHEFIAACLWQIENEGQSSLLEGLTLDLQPVEAEAHQTNIESDARRAISASASQIQRLMTMLEDGTITAQEAAEELPHAQRSLRDFAQLVADLTDRAMQVAQ